VRTGFKVDTALSLYLNPETWFICGFIWLLGFLPTSLLTCGPAWFFARKEVRWYWWEIVALLALPFYFGLFEKCFARPHKTWSNVITEGDLLSLLTCLAPLFRIAARDDENGQRRALVGILIVCIVGTFLWAFIPRLPSEIG
jgi:hypothetical protein